MPGVGFALPLIEQKRFIEELEREAVALRTRDEHITAEVKDLFSEQAIVQERAQAVAAELVWLYDVYARDAEAIQFKLKPTVQPNTRRLAQLRTLPTLSSSVSLPVLKKEQVAAKQELPQRSGFNVHGKTVPSMESIGVVQTEMSTIVFGNKEPRTKTTAEARRAARAFKDNPPTVLLISGIKVFGLPDADKAVGGGGSDPFVEFIMETDLETANINTGLKFRGRTETIFNAKRTVAFPDVVEISLPEHVGQSLVSGFCKARVRAIVWDDDSQEDGKEGINADDAVGEMATAVMDRSLKGAVDRATMVSIGELHSFLFSFRYACVNKNLVKH